MQPPFEMTNAAWKRYLRYTHIFRKKRDCFNHVHWRTALHTSQEKTKEQGGLLVGRKGLPKTRSRRMQHIMGMFQEFLLSHRGGSNFLRKLSPFFFTVRFTGCYLASSNCAHTVCRIFSISVSRNKLYCVFSSTVRYNNVQICSPPLLQLVNS